MSGSNFVRIVSLFDGERARSLETLARCYDDFPQLLRTVEELFSGELTRNKVQGKKILLKPNWVRHSLQPADELCLRTSDSVLLAALESVLKMQPAKVIVGDAPIQSAIWEQIASPALVENLLDLGRLHGVPVEVVDFRRVTFIPGKNELSVERRPLNAYVIFDVGTRSHLEPISSHDSKPFRVTSYNPDRLAESHRPGVHKYCIARELFDADIVISLPKVKTHQKAGITAALKNLVGLNGDKDYLPHHRLGGTGMGGDCYPGKNLLRYWSELAMDQANRHRGETSYLFWQKVSSLLWRLSFPQHVHQLAAGWYGNDTAWRMVMDLNLIAEYGEANGTLQANPVREIYSLCDGIIGGQGNGPLNPDPLPLGLLSFSNNAYANDLCWAELMKMDRCRIPMLLAAEKNVAEDAAAISWNGNPISLNGLRELGVTAQLPPGWCCPPGSLPS